MTFRPEFSWEFLSRDEIEDRSVRAVRNHIAHLKQSSPYYSELLSDLDTNDIKNRDDISKLPFTDKKTLVDNIGKFKAVDESYFVETVVTSGSTGKPLIYSLTKDDLERLAYNEALSFNTAGVGREDRAQILVSLDRLFIAGTAYYRGLTALGANTARIGVLPFEMQKKYLELLKPTVLVGVPSFIRSLGRKLQDSGCRTDSIGISKIVCIGESLRSEDMTLNIVGQDIEKIFGAKVFSTYGLTEFAVSYCECEEQCGNHSHPELIYTEIVDENGNPVPDGEIGELVGTPLGVEGIPLLRYRTGDITFKVKGSCLCGRNSERIGPILSRKSQMMKLHGTTVYPQTIISVLDGLDFIDDYVLIIDGDNSLSDEVVLHVATKPSDVMKIAETLRAEARVAIPVLVSNAPTINSYRGDSRKKIRIIDRRK